MQVVRVPTAGPDLVRRGLEQLAADPEVRSVLVLLAAQELPDAGAWNDTFAGFDLPVVGGVFPRVIDGDQLLSEGGVLLGLPVPMEVAVVHDLGDPEAVSQVLADTFGRLAADATVLTIMDAAADHVDELLESVFDHLGPFGSYLGGGAGSLRLVPEPCVVTNQGMLTAAALVAVIGAPATVGVAHGWQPIGPAMRVTKVGRRRIVELDHRPAAEVYREVLAGHAGLTVGPEEIASVAASYPLGIVGLDDEMVVRDPLDADGQELVCVAEVPQWAFVRVLHGDHDSLVDAAGRAAEQVRPGGGTGEPGTGHEVGLGLVFDCISRVLHLGDTFRDELAAVDLGPNRFGVVTIGEVCNAGDRFLELYNKTIVTANVRLPSGVEGG